MGIYAMIQRYYQDANLSNPSRPSKGMLYQSIVSIDQDNSNAIEKLQYTGCIAKIYEY